MTWLSEDPTVIVIVGIIVIASLIAGLVQTGRGALLYAIAGAAAVLVGLIVLERYWVTDREMIEDRLYATTTSLESNDVDLVLTHISPSATAMRAAVSLILPRVQIEDVNLGDIRITINELTSPPTANVEVVAMVKAKYQGQSSLYERTPVPLSVELVKENGQWLYSQYLQGPGSQGGGI